MCQRVTRMSCMNCVRLGGCDKGHHHIAGFGVQARPIHIGPRSVLTMTKTRNRPFITLAALLVGGTALAGCFGPTYGTGVTATDQLLDDLGNAISLGDRSPPPPINYTPRPGLVAPTNTSTLPTPQENIAEAAGAEWPESPEERRARIRREADEGVRDPRLITNQATADAVGASVGPGRSAPSATQRVFLTDPPNEYRQPAQTAAIGDVGVSESVKERRRNRAQNDGEGWRRFVPWL